jgi:hypothetical protein
MENLAAADFVDANDFHDFGRLSPNIFLLDNMDTHDDSCFCRICRGRRVDVITRENTTRGELRKAFILTVPLLREARSNAVFQTTLDLIVHGYVYKRNCLANPCVNGNRRYFKVWARGQPEYQRMITGTREERKQFEVHCTDVNNAAYCYEHWDNIVSNLTDDRMKAIDARNFSMAYFRLSANMNWCLGYNEKVRPKRKCQGDPPFEIAKVDAAFNTLVTTGIFEDIEHNPRLGASIGEQFQRKAISYCIRRYNPYQFPVAP